MKTAIFKLLATALVLCFLPFCGNQDEIAETAIGTRDIGHGTRIGLICRDKQGNIFEKSLQKFETATCGSRTINPKDYLDKGKTHGPFPGHEKEYEEYVKRLKKE